MRALLDTSFFVATESGRPLGDLGRVTATEVSVVTLAELTLGVLMAADDDARSTRLATLSAVESAWDPLPVDADVARQFARIAAALRAAGRRVPILDALVAATAIVERIPVVTQDGDYEAIPGVEVIRV
ncbi:PIN domain-containing protein [Aciditerrimonas ferrireducens]|jgi:predicted nucleic acid-binding protein|uniref:Ribonuclease VapC n=1 Tax=Aciditerrimonas ferrireducens TaxID=667306 RepID=A0ABV6BZB1_9ACTN|nr:PIN domain-containing protein [Aciditerrimonas ferrireducens]MCK4178069.1 PIN domain-containing protein [Aciditerrimonas ferrireducens]